MRLPSRFVRRPGAGPAQLEGLRGKPVQGQPRGQASRPCHVHRVVPLVHPRRLQVVGDVCQRRVRQEAGEARPSTRSNACAPAGDGRKSPCDRPWSSCAHENRGSSCDGGCADDTCASSNEKPRGRGERRALRDQAEYGNPRSAVKVRRPQRRGPPREPCAGGPAPPREASAAFNSRLGLPITTRTPVPGSAAPGRRSGPHA